MEQAKNLAQKGLKVTLFDVAPPRKYQRLDELGPRTKFVRGDITSWPEVLRVIEDNRIEEIYHTGALVSISCEENPQAGYMVNVNGTFNILEASALLGVKKVTFISSIAAYSLGQTETITNKSPQRPYSMYGVSKVCGELLGEYYHRKYGLDFRGVRFPSIIGPGRGAAGLSSYTSLMIQEPALGRPYEVYTTEDTVCAILYYKDALRCLIQLHEAPAERIQTKVYCIAGDLPTAEEIAKAVRDRIPNARLTFNPDPEKTRILKSWAQKIDESDAVREWGWKREYTLQQTIDDFIKEVRMNPELYT
ncbi:MAG: NAD-dependent epimerase/dehydratase family protein [Candidatus Bathyarchaeia archaeon]